MVERDLVGMGGPGVQACISHPTRSTVTHRPIKAETRRYRSLNGALYKITLYTGKQLLLSE